MKKIIYFIFALGLILWLGGSIIRNAIIFDAFVPATELTYKDYYSAEKIDYNIYLFISTSVYTNFAYGFALVSALIIAFMERKNIKKEGWLFMSLVLFLICSPIILYNIYGDYTLSRALFYDDFSLIDGDIRNTIFTRFKSNMNTILSGISYLSSLTIIAYAIWKPLVSEENMSNLLEEEIN